MKLGLLEKTARLVDFHFDERNFLNGLTEREFMTISDEITHPSHFRQAPVIYQHIILNILDQEKEKNINGVYHGTKMPATLNISARFVEYDAKIPHFAKGLSMGFGQRQIIKQGNDDLSRHVLHPDITNASPLDAQIHQAIFRSLHLGQMARPYGTTAAYDVVLHDPVIANAR